MVEHYTQNVEEEVHRFLKNGEPGKARVDYRSRPRRDNSVNTLQAVRPDGNGYYLVNCILPRRAGKKELNNWCRKPFEKLFPC